MLKKISFLSLIICAVGCLLVFLLFCKKEPVKKSSILQPITDYEQKRENMQKDIWVYKDKTRMQVRLKSPISWLSLQRPDKRWLIVETFQKLHLWMQDIKENNLQDIHYFQAEGGSYHYLTHQFTAQKIDLEFFKLDGSEIPLTFPSYVPYLSGSAKKIDFCFKDKMPLMTMEGFHSKLLWENFQ